MCQVPLLCILNINLSDRTLLEYLMAVRRGPVQRLITLISERNLRFQRICSCNVVQHVFLTQWVSRADIRQQSTLGVLDSQHI